jgi:hypothetical protein
MKKKTAIDSSGNKCLPASLSVQPKKNERCKDGMIATRAVLFIVFGNAERGYKQIIEKAFEGLSK